MAEKTYDLIVIGGGPGGYVCAFRAAQLGLKTALVDASPELGGTCLRVGCIPSKALLHSSELFHTVKHHGSGHGIKATRLSPDLEGLMKRKDTVVAQLCKGVRQLADHRKVDIHTGVGKISAAGKVTVSSGDADKSIELLAKSIVIATGSSVIELPFLKFDGKTVVSSTEALAFDKVPKKLVVVGAGAIGLELGSVWARLGSDVTVVEMLPNAAPGFDKDVSRLAQRFFKKQGLSFSFDTKVTGLKKKSGKTFLTAEKNGGQVEFEADKILVAVGRKPNTEGLGAQQAGIRIDARGRIEVDERFQTSLKGVYAIGDVIKGPMLAHKAEEEGVACAELIAGKAGHVNYALVPNVIYTEPEIAAAGLGEDAANESGRKIRVGKFPFAANGRALAMEATDGFVKVIADAESDRVLGVQIIGKNASELIAAAVSHMEYGGSAEDIGRTIHAHPTLSEALKEAALAVDKSALHAL